MIVSREEKRTCNCCGARGALTRFNFGGIHVRICDDCFIKAVDGRQRVIVEKLDSLDIPV